MAPVRAARKGTPKGIGNDGGDIRVRRQRDKTAGLQIRHVREERAIVAADLSEANGARSDADGNSLRGYHARLMPLLGRSRLCLQEGIGHPHRLIKIDRLGKQERAEKQD